MNEQQKERYNRHIILPEIGDAGQEKLLKAKVLVVGAGGLGCPVLQYLVAAGTGTIGIVEHDIVSLSNLQRQILYRENQIGQKKADIVKEALTELNSDCNIIIYRTKLTELNAEEIIKQYQIVVGCTDNFESRKVINKYTEKLGIPFVHGSICEYEGQVSVFNYNNGPSYTDLFDELPEEATGNLGVVGALPGIIGSIQASETIKIITGIGEVLSGRLLIFNILKASFNEFEF